MHAQNLLQHSKGPRARIYVEVEASVNRPEQQATFPTNTFQFTCAPRLSFGFKHCSVTKGDFRLRFLEVWDAFDNL